jgi:hypothetical protein
MFSPYFQISPKNRDPISSVSEIMLKRGMGG